MQEDTPLCIPGNPGQIPPSQFRLSRNMKVRGDAIYIIFSGIIGTVLMFFILMDTSAVLAIGVSWVPLVASTWFYFRFVRGRSKYYFEYWLNGLSGDRLRVASSRVIRLKARCR
ncbi:MAG: hypothetical protein JXR78_16695 [Victivallales bacterium]|nr:hypothetical protein [Victivallales bacterium]